MTIKETTIVVNHMLEAYCQHCNRAWHVIGEKNCEVAEQEVAAHVKHAPHAVRVSRTEATHRMVFAPEAHQQ